MRPDKERGYWVGCSGTPECAASGEDPTFKVQIVSGVAYLHCAKCGSFRTLEPQPKLYLSGMKSEEEMPCFNCEAFGNDEQCHSKRHSQDESGIEGLECPRIKNAVTE